MYDHWEREDRVTNDDEGAGEEPEELGEEAKVGPAGPDEALGVEDEEGSPQETEEHGVVEDIGSNVASQTLTWKPGNSGLCLLSSMDTNKYPSRAGATTD